MRRTRLLVALPAGLALIATMALAGCSGGGTSNASGAAAAEAAPAGASSMPSAGAASGAGAGSGQAGAARLAPAGQQLIYTAQLTVRARDVTAAVSRATAIVTTAGGYVSSENASSESPPGPGQPTATVELKVPVAVYAATLAELSGTALGTRLSLRQQTQDVTEQVADVSSRVASDEAAITQLRALLSRAGSVGDLLSVQNQIDSEESDLEAMQAQQSALNRETAFATVTITIVGPRVAPKPKPRPKPAPGLLVGLSGGWHALRVAVSWLLAIIGAAAPFAAVVAVAGGAGYGIRRWLAARAARGVRSNT